MQLSPDKFYMSLCYMTAMNSDDPSTRSGCVITTKDHELISIGYNRFPKGIQPNSQIYRVFMEEKNKHMVHAEHNAMDNANASLKDAILYINWIPCYSCARSIVNRGIRQVIMHKEGQETYERLVGNKKANNLWDKEQQDAIVLFTNAKVQWDIRSIEIIEELGTFMRGSGIPAKELNYGSARQS